jgi:hydroxyacylglutathione hydrolase
MQGSQSIQLGDYKITTVMTGEPWRQNCYIVCHRPSLDQIVIDPGGAADTIIQSVMENGGNLNWVLLTHAHHDHIGAVNAISQEFDLSCYLHKDDSRLLRHAPMYALRFGGQQIENVHSYQTYDHSPRFTVGNQIIDVIRTPGHTPGSVCYGLPGFIFTGDTLLFQHIGRTDLPGSDLDQLLASVGHLVQQLPGDTMIFPGHGQGWTVEEARIWWSSVDAAMPQYYGTGA